MEEKKERKIGIIALLLVIILIIVAIVVFFVVNNSSNKETKTSKEETETKTLIVTKNIEKKLQKFVEAGSYYDDSGSNTTVTHFISGTTELPKDIKLKMTRNAIYQAEKVKTNVILSEEEINNIQGEKPSTGEPVDVIEKDTLNNTYKELFNETVELSLSELEKIGCPVPMAVNKTSGAYYLFNRCGGTGALSYKVKVTHVSSDKDYFYAHSEITEIRGITGEEKVTKLLWTFDKDLKFVNTKKEDK